MKNELIQTQEKLSQSTLESEQLHAEMTVVNQFISKFLLGMNRKQTTNSVKLDKLTEVLAENRGLLIDMTKEESETIDLGAFLPRALYDLVAEVDEESAVTDESECSEEDGAFNEVQTASPEQIADKLPKVWRVLIELVNHQERVQQVPFVVGVRMILNIAVISLISFFVSGEWRKRRMPQDRTNEEWIENSG